MALELSISVRTPPALPTYAHPPLVTVRMGIRCSAPVVVDLQRLATELGPSWIKSAAVLRAPHGNRTGLDDEPWPHVFAGVLGDQRLKMHSHGLEFVWDGSSGETYPHYETLRDTFVAAFDAWTLCAETTTSVPQRWHVSYWNRIPQGTVWNSLDDLRFCKLLASAGETPFAQQLTDFQQSWIYRGVPPQSQLRCDAWLEADEKAAGESVIWLALTSSGESDRPNAAADADGDWLSGLDAGRRSIVSAFRGLMSPEANAYWGLND